MAIGVGISGPRGGGGVPSLADPSSFADAVTLFRSDVGQVFVDDLLDTWENQGTDGGDASATSSTHRIITTAHKTTKDLVTRGHQRFNATGLPTGVVSSATYDVIITPHSSAYYYDIPSVGNSNSSANIIRGLLVNNNIQFTIAYSGTSANINYSATNIVGASSLKGRHLKLTLVYDGSGATNADKVKLYSDGVLITQTSVSGTIPTTFANTAGAFSICSNYASRGSNFLIGYVGYWERALSGDEISANNDWKKEIWS